MAKQPKKVFRVETYKITISFFIATIGADFLTKEVVVDDRVVTMQVNVYQITFT